MHLVVVGVGCVVYTAYEKDVSWDRVTHIVTRDLPCYFAVLSRVHQQQQPVGPAGAVVHSDLVPAVSVALPPPARSLPPHAAPLTLQARPLCIEIPALVYIFLRAICFACINFFIYLFLMIL